VKTVNVRGISADIIGDEKTTNLREPDIIFAHVLGSYIQIRRKSRWILIEHV